MANLQQYYRTNGRHAQNVARDRLEKYTPHQVKLEIAEENWSELKKQIREAIRRGDQWACLAVYNTMVGNGSGQTVIVNLCQELGVTGPEQLRGLIQSGRRLERLASGEINLEESVQRAVEVLKMAFAERPDLRPNVLKELGSYAEEIGGAPAQEITP